MLILFLLSVLFCLYTYAIFPLWLAWRTRKCHRQVLPSDHRTDWPGVSVIVAAYNEENNLGAKLKSLFDQDYPKSQLDIIVISDGSTDGSEKILRESDLIFEHYLPAKGKPTALNKGVEKSNREFVVFTDARQPLSNNALKALIARFDDDSVGVVSGELVMTKGENLDAANVGLYWRYEKWIRQNESLLFSTTGATGALYAARRELVPTLNEDTLLDDFEIPVQILKTGLRTVFEPQAKAFDRPEEDSGKEYQRKVRTLTGNFQSFSRNRWLFNPVKNPVFWQFLSHKVFRLLVPVAMFLALIASVVGSGWLLNLGMATQLTFYSAGLCAFLFPGLSDNRLLNFIKIFLQMNCAAVVGAVRYFSGSHSVHWKKTT